GFGENEARQESEVETAGDVIGVDVSREETKDHQPKEREVQFSTEEIQNVAYKIWEEKGRPFQDSEEERKADWFKAVDLLMQKREAQVEMEYEVPSATLRSEESQELQEEVSPGVFQEEDYEQEAGETENEEPTEDEIRTVARELWEQEGRPYERDKDYWFEAKARITRRRKAEAQNKAVQAQLTDQGEGEAIEEEPAQEGRHDAQLESEQEFTDEEISPIAFEIYEKKMGGRALEDWFEAVDKLREEVESQPQENFEESKGKEEADVRFSDEEIGAMSYVVWEEKGRPFQANQEDRDADWLEAVNRLKQQSQEVILYQEQTQAEEPAFEEISAVARQVWEDKGRPEGQDGLNWKEAEEMVRRGKIGQA
ncbi:MAG: DUF2934 domain-containing protein, partial [Candidatus Levybacteria bacterium]|nr:DUF2934 domain-containing protein [Candidatus Levybacteria bacterium]